MQRVAELLSLVNRTVLCPLSFQKNLIVILRLQISAKSMIGVVGCNPAPLFGCMRDIFCLFSLDRCAPAPLFGYACIRDMCILSGYM